MKHLLKLTFLSIFVINYSGVYAQKSMNELAALPAKKFMKMVTTTPSGVRVAVDARQLSWDNLPPKIENVGLLSFFVYSSGNNGNGYYSALTEEGGNVLATQLKAAAVPNLTSSLKSNGFALIEPKAFASTDAQKGIYENSKIELSGAMKFAQGFQNRFGKGETDNESAVADGYVLYTASLMGEDIKLSRGVGKVAKELDLDATLTVHFETDLSGKNIVLEGITLSMHAPNPEPYDANKTYKGISKGTRGYWEGIHLGSVSLKLAKPFAIAQYSKKAISAVSTDGLDKVLEIMTAQLIATMNAGFKKSSAVRRR